ncbi:protein Cms1p [Diutina catenulata]
MEQHFADDLADGLVYDIEFGEDATEDVVATRNIHDDILQVKQTDIPKKRKQVSELKDRKRAKMEEDTRRKKNISKEEPGVIADYLNDKVRRTNSDLSALELAEKYFTKQDVRSTADFDKERTLSNLEEFINGRFKNMLNPKSSETEKKYIAVVSSSAIRACDVHRATKNLKNSSLKLIAKNKLSADVEVVNSSSSRILCATPARLIKVLSEESCSVKLEEIKIIIVDNSYLDKKQQNIWDMPGNLQPLKRLTSFGAKLYFY